MRGRQQFAPAMLKMLERKRTEKLARERSHQFTRAPECWLKSALGTDARQAKPTQDDNTLIGGLIFRVPPQPHAVQATRCTTALTVLPTGASRAAKHYAALHAEEKQFTAKAKAKTRRKKATAIDTKRLKVAVERVRKPSITKPSVSAGARTHSEPTYHWLGRTRHPGLELGPDGGE